MQSSLVSRALLVVVALTLAVCLPGCMSVNRQAREAALTSSLADLIPGGRIYSNDLASGRQLQLISAALFDPELVVEDAHGRLTCLDRHSLATKWYFAGLPAPMEFPATVGPASMVMISDGKLFEVDRRYGTQLGGAVMLRFVPSAAAAATGGTAFVPSLAATEGYRTLITVNLANGLEGWGIATRGSIVSAPVVAGSSGRPMLYFATEGKRVFAYPAESSSGAPPESTWSHRTHGPATSSPVVSGELLLVASEAGELWALSRVTGVESWVHYSGSPIHESPWAAGDQVYFTNEEGFFALDRSTGAVKWSFDSPAHFVVRRADAVYVATEDGTVHALDPESGKVLRAKRFGSRTLFLANTTDEVFYLVTAGGLVFAVDKPLP